MTKEFRPKLLRWINRGKNAIQAQKGFFDDPELRGVYVTLLTLEGAVMFSDVPELAEICGQFCKKKSRDVIISG